MYVGHLYPGKGVEIVTAMASRMPQADFHVVGGTEEDLALWQEAAGQMANLHFHGHVPSALTGAYHRRADVLLAPCQEQICVGGWQTRHRDIGGYTSPLKVFEYMASRKPMICSDLPVIREVLSDGENALLVPPADVDAWVQAAMWLFSHPAEAEWLAANAYEMLRAQFTWDSRAARVLAGIALRSEDGGS
jgi:glycosyltransferase involved in cell wall biosynthesis